MKNANNSSSSGVGFIGLLTILFIGLKLTGNIAWSWWWVFCPIWIIPAIVIAGIMISIIVHVKNRE